MLSRLVASPVADSHQVAVISLLGRGDLSSEVERKADLVWYLRFHGLFSSIFSLFRLCMIALLFRPHVTMGWAYQANLATLAIKIFRPSSKLIWSIRQTNLSKVHNRWTTRFVIGICASLSAYLPDRIISNSYAAKLTHAGRGFVTSKVVVVPNGIDLTIFKPSRARRIASRQTFSLNKNSFVIGMVARYDSQKNHIGFVDAVKKVCLELPNVIFVFCGKNLNEENYEFITELKRQGVLGRCRLIGQQDDVPFVLNGFDLLVSPSLGEGWPNVVGEAMACGVPCVASDVGDTALIIGEAGSVAKAEDMDDLAQKLVRYILSTSKNRKALAVAARKRIERNFDILMISERYFGLLAEVSGRQK